jgi:Bacterial transglutaminase-like cysteine proteinase BTLCP
MMAGAMAPGVAQAQDAATARWEAMRAYVAGLPATHRIGMVNAMFNNFQFKSDRDLHGVDDRWDAPLEFVARGAGDCEDFAIAKYFMLMQAGVDPRDLKLGYALYTSDSKAAGITAPAGPRRGHIVALYHGAGHEDDPLVLDLISEVAPLSARGDLHMVFDFDHRATYAIHDATTAAPAVQQMVSRLLPVLQRSGMVDGVDALRVAARRAPAEGVLVSSAGSPLQLARAN